MLKFSPFAKAAVDQRRKRVFLIRIKFIKKKMKVFSLSVFLSISHEEEKLEKRKKRIKRKKERKRRRAEEHKIFFCGERRETTTK